MTIAFSCISCANRLKVDDAHIGSQVTCPYCREIVTVPRAGEERPVPVAAPIVIPAVPPLDDAGPPLRGREPDAKSRREPATLAGDSPRSAAAPRKIGGDVARFYRIFAWSCVTLLVMTVGVIGSMFLLPGDRPDLPPIAKAAMPPDDPAPAPQPAAPEPAPPQPAAEQPAPQQPAAPAEAPLKLALRKGTLNDKGQFSAVSSIREEDGIDAKNPGMRGIIYAVELDAHHVYRIVMTSTRMSPSLRVLAPNGVDLLPAEVELDEKTEARVLFTTTKSDVYRIVATTKSYREVGPFSLRIIDQGPAPAKEVAVVVPKNVAEPPPLPGQQPGAPLPIVLVGGKFELNGVIDAEDLVANQFGAGNRPWLGHTFEVDLKKGQRYQIDLISNRFDAYLYLHAENGTLLMADDDSGGGLNARILYTPTVAGKYRIVATSLGKASTGPFTFRVAEAEQVAALVPRGFPPLPNRPIPNQFDPFPPAPIPVQNALFTTGPVTPIFLAGGKSRTIGEIVPSANPAAKLGRIFDVELSEDRTYRIDLKSDELDAVLIVLDGTKALAQDDDSGGNLNARLLFAPPATRKYRILATSVNQRMTGKFVLEIAEKPRAEPPLPRPEPNEPFSPDPKARGVLAEFVEGAFTDKGRIGPADLVSRAGKRLGKTYEVDLKAGRTYRLSLEYAPALVDGLRSPPLVFVYDPATFPSRISGQGAIGSLVTTFAPPKDARYVFTATTMDGRGIGPFTFRVVEENRLAANDPLRDPKRTSPPLGAPIAVTRLDPAAPVVPGAPFVPGPREPAPGKPPIAGRIVDGKFNVRGSFESKSASLDFAKREGITYEVELRDDRRYRIELTAPEGNVGVLIYEAPPALPSRQFDGVATKNFRSIFSPRKTATYRIMVNQGRTDPAAPFELTFTEEPRDAPPPPILPREITPVMPRYKPAAAPTQVKLKDGKLEEKGSFARTDRISTVGTRCGKTFELELTANKSYRLELEFEPGAAKTASAMPRIIVYPSAPDSAGLATTKQANDFSVLTTFRPTATDRYVIVVTSYSGFTAADYTFRVIEEK